MIPRFLPLFAVLLGSAWAQDKPIAYNKADGGDTPLDRAIRKIYADRYDIRDASYASGYQAPRPTAGGLPDEALGPDGRPLEGYVLVTYIVSKDGRAADPHILTSTNDALNATALEAMKDWRFEPGTFKGEPANTTAAQEFVFKGAKPGLETTNIVLYQPDDVLKTRLGGPGRLAAYIEKIQSAAGSLLGQVDQPGTLVIVTAVRPGGQARVWLIADSLDARTRDSLRATLEAIPPVEVTGGPVAFALCARIADGPEYTEVPPMPPEWRDAAAKLPAPVLVPDAILQAIWPAP